MSQNIEQIYLANPITSNASTDLFYVGQSPFGAGDDAAIQYSDFAAQLVASGTANDLAYYATSGNKVSALTTANNGLLVTSAAGVPSILAGPGVTGKMLQSNASAAPSWSTATFPSTAGATGTILRSDGTNWVASTATFADTYGASTLLYSNGANTVTGLATANNGFLITNGSGVPSITNTVGAGLTFSAGNVVISAGTLTASGNIQSTGGNLYSGVSTGGHAGSLILFSNTASNGYLQVQAIDNPSNFQSVINNSAVGQATVYRLPDPGTGVTNFIISDKATTQTISSPVSVTGNFTPSQTNGIVGTTTNNNANAGSVGEYLSSVISVASAVSLTNNAATQITFLSLSAGDWDIYGNVTLTGAAGTLLQYYSCWAGTGSVATPDPSLWSGQSYGTTGVAVFAENQVGDAVPFIRVSLASPANVYLAVTAGFTTSTCSACGGLFARRRR